MPDRILLDALEVYLRDIAIYTELSDDEERGLVKRAQSGDIDARNKLIETNLQFVVKVAQHYQNKSLTMLELISEGNTALIQAITKFDTQKEIRFRNYAFYYIKKNIVIALLQRGSPIKVSSEIKQIVHKINRARQALYTKNGVEPTTQQISKEIDISIGIIRKIIDELISLPPADNISTDNENIANQFFDGFLNGQRDNPLTQLMRDRLQSAFNDAIYNLDPLETTILKSYHGMDGYKKKSFVTIAKDTGKNRESIRQIYQQTLQKIAKSIVEENCKLIQMELL